MVLVEVQVERAGVVVVWATEECGGNLGYIFFVVVPVALSRCEAV